MKKIVYHILALSLCLTTACKAGFENDLSTRAVDSGKVDFTTYVALGNSLTAGYQDGTLFRSGQRNAYPAILAKQMDPAGRMGEFKQPLMEDDRGGIALNLNGVEINVIFTKISLGETLKNYGIKGYGISDLSDVKLVLSSEGGTLIPKRTSGIPATPLDNVYKAKGPFNNMGVPGAKSYELTASIYGDPSGLQAEPRTSNPYFIRMASAETASVLGDALKQKPSFFSLWIGSNDVLFYALAGGTNTVSKKIVPAKDRTGDSNYKDYKPNDITDPGLFKLQCERFIKALTDAGAKGVVANIPAVTSIPYFTTAKWDGLNLNAAEAKALSPFVDTFNQALEALQKDPSFDDKDLALRKLHYAEGDHNPFLIVDTDLEDISDKLMTTFKPLFRDQALSDAQLKQLGQARPAQAGDFIVLKALQALREKQKGEHLGVIKPLGDELVLTQAEAQKVATATAAYNQAIKALADEYGLAFVDADAKLKPLAEQGIRINGNSYTAEFVKGGAFSLDGIHPNARGYAIVANAFIKAINARYGSSLPQVDPNAYPGVVYP